MCSNYPLNRDIRWVQLNYGVGISAFFAFYRFTVINNFLTFIAYSYFLINQLLEIHSLTFSKSQILPHFTMFSNLSNTKPILFSSAIILTMILLTFTSFFKWIKENKKTITAKLLSNQSSVNQFNILSFNCWKYNLFSKKAVEEQKISIAEKFRFLLTDEAVQNIKQARTKKEKYMLYARRTIGIFLNIIFVVLSWYAILRIIEDSTSIITVANKSLSIPLSVATFVPTMLLTLVGLVLPSITFAITDFEKWESHIQTMKHQTWRLYCGRILNLVVAGMQFYSLRHNVRLSIHMYPGTFAIVSFFEGYSNHKCF